MGMPFYTDYQNTKFRGYSLYRTAPLVLLSVYILNSPLLFELHWLPVEHRIVFKILLLVFKSLNDL